jgi:hypothetical protein
MLKETMGLDTEAGKGTVAVSAQDVMMPEPKFKLPRIINFFIPGSRSPR